ncbi:MAG: phosphotransferase [Planctomycetes bacterium]|nr:phosphotransferase [Planctomycetota bacterium]
MVRWQVAETLKQDQFGRVERLVAGDVVVLRRVACGSRIPLSGVIARALMRRERRALRALDGMCGVPRVVEDARAASAPSADGTVPRVKHVLLRSWIAGAPLHRAEALPEDYFELLDALVHELHARGVCHNDLHKEQNLVVDPSGRPALIDFQLASVHASGGRLFESRVRDDLRHVQKHRRRYTRDGRGPRGVDARRGAGHGVRRSRLAAVWRRLGKPAYNFFTRRVLGTRDGEERRDSSGPWPRWTPPVGRGGPKRGT